MIYLIFSSVERSSSKTFARSIKTYIISPYYNNRYFTIIYAKYYFVTCSFYNNKINIIFINFSFFKFKSRIFSAVNKCIKPCAGQLDCKKSII